MKDRGSIILRTLVAIGLISSFVFGEAGAVDRGLKITVKNSAGITNDVDLYSGYHALVIGIGNYRSPWSALPGAIEDAREVAETFQSIGWDTTLLENPTGNELKRSFNRLIAGPGRDSQKAILVWFSGHGYTLKQFDGTPSGYLVPSDAPNPESDEVGFRGKAMDMASIEQISKSILSKHVLMVFDSCFSGSLFTVSRALKPSPYIQMKTLKPVRQFITAGQADEKVPDNSIFQKVFLQGLGDRYADLNRDGYVTGEELGSYLQEKVTNYSNNTQHPQYAKINHYLLDKGDFVFVLPNARRADVPDRRVQELELWVNIRDSDDPMFFKDFLQRFPDGIYAGLAELRLNNLLEPKPAKKKESKAALTASLYGLGKSSPNKQFAIMLEAVFGIEDSEWIGGRLDERDWLLAGENLQDSLEGAIDGATLSWNNLNSGHSGSASPTRTAVASDGTPCREFTIKIIQRGEAHQGYGTACRQADGSWKTMM